MLLVTIVVEIILLSLYEFYLKETFSTLEVCFIGVVFYFWENHNKIGIWKWGEEVRVCVADFTVVSEKSREFVAYWMKAEKSG